MLLDAEKGKELKAMKNHKVGWSQELNDDAKISR